MVRRIALVPRQQLPAGRQRLPQPAAVGQHAHDAQDPDRPVLRVVARLVLIFNLFI